MAVAVVATGQAVEARLTKEREKRRIGTLRKSWKLLT
jgi:hypothetical protein